MMYNDVSVQHYLLDGTDLNVEKSRIRIYGNVLGTTNEIIALWNAIEKNYLSIIAYERMITIFKTETESIPYAGILNSKFGRLGLNLKREFMEYCENYNISDIISPNEYPIITKINFNSPGFWEVIGQWSPFEQLRKYIQERHLRNKDKKFGWEIEKQTAVLDLETKRISNDLLKLDLTQKIITQLKEIGFSDIEIRNIVQKSYGNLELLNEHIDEGRITDIREIILEEDQIEKNK